jgi:hypothetical protein
MPRFAVMQDVRVVELLRGVIRPSVPGGLLVSWLQIISGEEFDKAQHLDGTRLCQW